MIKTSFLLVLDFSSDKTGKVRGRKRFSVTLIPSYFYATQSD